MQEKIFDNKLHKSGFVANVKWREEPGFGMLHHINIILTESQNAFCIFVGQRKENVTGKRKPIVIYCQIAILDEFNLDRIFNLYVIK